MYYSIEEMLEMIDGPNRSACKKLLKENEKLFRETPGSSHNHQAWPGGYWDHVQETMNWAVDLYETMTRKRSVNFTLSSALLVLFLHDIEKPWSYELDANGETKRKNNLASKIQQREFRDQKLKEYCIILSEKEENAMKYVEGERNDYTNKRRVMNELAGFCHICDVISARIFHSRPLEKNEPWGSRLFKPKTKTSAISSGRFLAKNFCCRALFCGRHNILTSTCGLVKFTATIKKFCFPPAQRAH